jgi:PAS domain S-box-containing protein
MANKEARTAELQAARTELAERTAELQIINSVQQALASQLSMQSIYDLVGDKIRDIFDAQVVMITTYDQAAQLATPHYVIEKGQRFYYEPYPYGGLARHLIRTRQPLLVGENMVQHMAKWGTAVLPGTEVPKSNLTVPLIVGNEVTGSISLENMDREHAFSESDVRLLTTVANSMSVALENVRLFAETKRLLAETQQRTRELELMNAVQQGLATRLDFQAIIDLVGDKLREAFGGASTFIALYDEASNRVETPYFVAEDGRRVYAEPFELGQGLTSIVIKTRRPVVFGTFQEMLALGALIEEPEKPLQEESWMGVPILVGERVIGVVAMQDYPKYQYSETDVRLLTTITAGMGVALENARLFEETNRLLAETEQRAAELAIVNRISRALASQLDLEALIELVGDQVRAAFEADIAYVALLDRQAGLIRFPYQVGERYNTLTLGQGLTSRILQTGQPLLINQDIAARRAELGIERIGKEVMSYLGVPITIGQEAAGVISVQSTTEEGRFDEDDLRLLTTIAANVGAALQTARLFSEVQAQKYFSESLVQNTPVAIITGTGGSAVTSWNPAAERLFGYTQDEALGRDLDELVVPPEMRSEGSHFRDQIMAGEALHTVTRRARKDGSLVDVELLSVRVTVPGQEPGYIAIYHDITELTAATREIEESQRRLADIIDFLPDATLVIDREGRVIAWNHAIEEMTGVEAPEIMGKDNYEHALPFYGERRPILIDLVLLPDEEIESKYTHLQREGAILQGEALVPQLRGRPAYLYATASALRDSSGAVVGAIETIRDISDRKQAEEELRQAKAAAEAATQAKSAFLATMSHEIRTPMNAVIGMTSLLLDTPLNAEQRDFAETIRTSGDALLAVINDILDFSKIEAGRIDLERQPFDLRECVESALSLVAGQAAGKGLELGCWIDPQVPAGIMGDETRLRQMVLNLLSNAIKFTEEGEVLVTVERSGEVVRPLQELHFAVRDTGVGIPADRMDRLFQSFSQVDSSTTRKYGGTGLGLAISSRLAELMGGRMWAESAGIAGQGSTFHFVIQAQPASVPARLELEAGAPGLQGRRVLIVDDNATSRRILALQTKGWGMVPQPTGSPAEALDWVRQGEAFDVAIVDCQMPEIDGVMLAAELGKLNASLPLLMVSSLGRGEVQESQRFAAVLLKPVRASQLYRALMRILAGRPEGKVAEPAAPVPQFDAELGVRQPLRILLAEDNVVNQKLALRLLERLGYRADVAADGVEVLRALERQPYDVVFMDVQMPEMDGLEATREIVSRWAVEKRPRIIAMTANALAEDRDACLAAGMDDYLAKPIRVEELVAALSKVTALAS